MVVKSPVFIAVAGQSFSTRDDWINRASSILTSHPKYKNTSHLPIPGWRGHDFTASCFDQMGRRCLNGGDFQRAENDDAFPVWWVWPDQIAELIRKEKP